MPEKIPKVSSNKKKLLATIKIKPKCVSLLLNILK